MKRREFITLLGGSAACALPPAARAQQGERVRRIGVLGGYAVHDPEVAPRVDALRKGLEELGWSEGRTIRLDYRWAAGDANRMRAYATELASQNFDLILTSTTPTLRALQQVTRTIPIVFVAISDPVGDGFVTSLAQPGGNITGFSSHDPAMAGKWLELLKECAPTTTRVAILFNPDTAPHSVYLPLIRAAAQHFSVELISAAVRNATEMETAIAQLGAQPGGGLLVMPDASNAVHREVIFALTARFHVPAIFYRRYFTASGGLMSYGADDVDQHKRAAAYIDRILRGARPAELPVQAPTKFELVINLKTAKALGVTVPPALLARADEVIE
jgi:putative ABC transport system substrate-binding protein